METVQNLMANYTSPETLITQEVLKAVSSFSCSESFFKTLKSLAGNGWKILLFFVIHHYLIKNPQNIIDFVKTIGRMVMYRRKRLSMKEVNADLIMARRIQKNVKDGSEDVNGLPVYSSKDGDELVVEYCPVIHTFHLTETRDIAEKEYSEYKTKLTTKINTLGGKDIEPKVLFPSVNYTKGSKMVRKFFSVAETTGMFRSLGALLNGRPGLGKTDFLAFIARMNLVKNALYVDMTKHLSKSFDDVVKAIYAAEKAGTYVIFIDELDKYQDQRIREEFKMECRTISERNEKTEGSEALPEWGEYLSESKTKFVYKLLNLIETENFADGVIFFFCSNNFETLFEGVSDMHTRSLKRRFLNLKFEMCGCEEFKDYVRFFNEKNIGTSEYTDKDTLEMHLKNVREDLLIPFSNIHFANIEACFEVERLVEIVNEWEDDTPLDVAVSSPPITPKVGVVSSESTPPKSSSSKGESSSRPQTKIKCRHCDEKYVLPGEKYCNECIEENIVDCGICGEKIDCSSDDSFYCDSCISSHCLSHTTYCEECDEQYCPSDSSDHNCPVCNEHFCEYHLCDMCFERHVGQCTKLKAVGNNTKYATEKKEEILPEIVKENNPDDESTPELSKSDKRTRTMDELKRIMTNLASANEVEVKMNETVKFLKFFVEWDQEDIKVLYRNSKLDETLIARMKEFDSQLQDPKFKAFPKLSGEIRELIINVTLKTLQLKREIQSEQKTDFVVS